MPELRYHHIGIPTDRPLPAEDYSETYKLYASEYFQSPYGVEWMKFDEDCRCRIWSRPSRTRRSVRSFGVIGVLHS
jgi:hypothetical protein